MSIPILPDLHAAHAATEAARRAALLSGDAAAVSQHTARLTELGTHKLTAQVQAHVTALAALDQEDARLAADDAPATATMEAARAAVLAAEKEERDAPVRLAQETESKRRAFSVAYATLQPVRNRRAALEQARAEHQGALTALLEGGTL